MTNKLQSIQNKIARAKIHLLGIVKDLPKKLEAEYNLILDCLNRTIDEIEQELKQAAIPYEQIGIICNKCGKAYKFLKFNECPYCVTEREGKDE